MSRIAELIGPAGAGKSTLARSLVALDARVQRAPVIPRHHHVLAVGRALGAGLPFEAPYSTATRKGLKRMVHLEAIKRYVDRRPSADSQTMLLFDEGPVYYLARMRVHGGRYLNSDSVGSWWERTVDHWRRRMDCVVVLDAPDETLVRRINERAQPHPNKGVPFEETREFLGAYRRAYEDLIEALCVNGDTALLRVDTERPLAPDALAGMLEFLTGPLPSGPSSTGSDREGRAGSAGAAWRTK